MTHYEKYCKEECPRGCGENLHKCTLNGKVHHESGLAWLTPFPCTAPSLSKWGERMAQERDEWEVSAILWETLYNTMQNERDQLTNWESLADELAKALEMTANEDMGWRQAATDALAKYHAARSK